MRILIIDDDQPWALSTARHLDMHDHEVAYAPDAIAAISSALAEKPHLILLDMRLPAGHGTLVLGRLRLLSATAFTPIIIITGGVLTDQQVQECDGHGVHDVMYKPVTRDALLAAVHTAVPYGV